jgi:hypothetical protein
MDNILTRFSEHFVARLTGPLSFRFILQPVMASIFAFRDGIRDAKGGKPAYLWSLFTEKGRLREQMRETWKSIGRIILLAIAMDFVYQIIELHWIYLGEVVVMAIVLAIVPYVLLRGPVNRVARQWLRGKTASRHV